MSEHTVVLIPGDGIGPEISEAVKRIFSAAKAPIRWVEHFAGLEALERGGELLPASTLDAIRGAKVALKGPCTTPIGGGFRSVNVTLRKALDLYTAVRPIRSMPGVPTRYEGVDIIVLRENTEGLYSGIENEIAPGVVTSLKVVTERASRRFARYGFEYSRKRGRKKVTAMHKANIMKLGDGLFIRCAREEHEKAFLTAPSPDGAVAGPRAPSAQKALPELAYEELIIDAGCMRLVQDPTRFDVLLLENLYGDVLSDLCAGFIGGLGVAPGANLGDDYAVFEAVHGSAPDIAGQGIANPMSLLMSGVMMLNHMTFEMGMKDCKAAADAIKGAYNAALAEGDKTGDIGGNLSTTEFADAIIRRLA